jgi:hypothetical protein
VDAQRRGVAVRAAVAFRNDEEEDHRRDDDANDEETDEEAAEDERVGHASTRPTAQTTADGVAAPLPAR